MSCIIILYSNIINTNIIFNVHVSNNKINGYVYGDIHVLKLMITLPNV